MQVRNNKLLVRTCTHYITPRIASMCKRGSRCLQKMSSSVSRKQQLRICLPPECSIEKKLRLLPRLAPTSMFNDVWRQIHVQFKNTNHSIKICMNIHTAFAPSQIIDVFHPSRKYASKTTKRYSENRCSWVKKHICWPTEKVRRTKHMKSILQTCFCRLCWKFADHFHFFDEKSKFLTKLEHI